MSATLHRRRFHLAGVALLAFLLQAASASRAAEDEKPWYERISFHAFAETSYSYNFNRPESGANRYRVFDFDDNSFKLDVAELVAQKTATNPGDTGFRLDLAYGSSIPPVLASLDPSSSGEGPSNEDVHQAYVTWVVPVGSGLKLDGGKFVTPLGYEVIDGYDGYNDNATRSFLFGYALPATHTGLRAGYAFSPKVAVTLLLVNGWDNARDNNPSKTVGAQVALTPIESLAVYVNGMVGSERDRGDPGDRSVLDLFATWKATSRLTLGINGDRGTEENAPLSEDVRSDVVWSGVALYGKYAFTARFSLAARVEQFDDGDGWRTGVSQTLREFTLTPEFRVNPNLIFRGDLRFDRSDEDVFEKHDGGATDHQSTVLVSAIFSY